jgi:RecA/RadA recombinase
MGFADKLVAAGLENKDKQEVQHWLSTGYPVLDHRLSGKYHGGGFAGGRIIEVIGPSSSGKTAIATNALKCAQEGGGLAGFDDHERSFDAGLGESFGLSLDPNNWSYDAPNTFEQSIDRMRGKVLLARGMTIRKGEYVTDPKEASFDPNAPFAWVFDSLAAMVPNSAMFTDKGDVKDADDRNMNDNTALARATSNHFPQLAKFAEQTNTCLIFLNQIRTKFGAKVMPGREAPMTSPGGGAPEFYATQRLRLGRNFIVDKDNGFKKLGQEISCEVFKNKVWRPFEKCKWDFMFQDDGTGRFDVVGGVVDELCDLKILDKTAQGFITWVDGKKYYKKVLVPMIEQSGQVDALIAMLPE